MILGLLGEAFFGQRLVTISYEDQLGRLTVRQIEAQFLYYNLPVWYVLVWERLRGGTILLDRPNPQDRCRTLAISTRARRGLCGGRGA